MLSYKAAACCYGSSAIHRNNSGATNLLGFCFNGKENSKTKNTLFICNYGNTNTRKTEEDCIIRPWKVFYGGFKERRGIQWTLWSKEGKRKKNPQKNAERGWHLLPVSTEHTQRRIPTDLGRAAMHTHPKTFRVYIHDTMNPAPTKNLPQRPRHSTRP